MKLILLFENSELVRFVFLSNSKNGIIKGHKSSSMPMRRFVRPYFENIEYITEKCIRRSLERRDRRAISPLEG